MNIFLIGFMGTGKSTVAEALHKTYGLETAEMDQLIAEREKMSISDIFAKKGEDYFRKAETALLKELGAKKDVVVSCGGGVPMRPENVEIMKSSGIVVLLMARPETILSRLKDDHSRPLLEGHMNTEYIASLMEKREPAYRAAADITLWVDEKSPADLCREIQLSLEA